MKLKRCLAVMMSTLLMMYSFPVYATSERAEERKEELLTEESSADEESESERNTYVYDELNTDVCEESGTDADTETEEEENSETETEETQIEPKIETVESKADLSITTAEDDIASGVSGDIEWVIDKDGKLTVEGTGEFINGSSRAPWYSARTAIISAEISVEGITDLGNMFESCKNLKSVDLSGLNTGNVTDMGNMFYECSSLTSVDLSGLDTGNVTSMVGMFYECSGLTSVDLSGFDMRNVTDMGRMFWGCSGLTSVDLSGLNAQNVAEMENMFHGCSSLTSVDLSDLNTGNVNMYGMFWDCSSLTNVDLGGLGTRNVTSTGRMFSGCSSLTNVDLNSLDIGKVVYMPGMFADCSNLTSVELNSFEAKSVENVGGMFSGCSSLTSVDLSSLSLGHMDSDLQNMFNGCTQLATIKTPKNIVAEILLPVSDDGYNWYYVKEEITSLPLNLSNSVEIKRIKNAVSEDDIASGTYGDITWVIDADGKLTVTGTGEFASRNPHFTPDVSRAPWFEYRESILSAEISIKNLTDLSCMFYECKNMTSIDLSRLDTSDATDMSAMFELCSALKSIDVSKFDTSNVTNMWAMFNGCIELESIDVSQFDTSKVTDMSGMFSQCWALKNIDVSKFNTSNVTDMSHMFMQCMDLESLDVSGFNTSKVTNMSAMFDTCSKLSTIDVSGFDTSNVTSMSYMFVGLDMQNVDVSRFNTSKVTNMQSMFRYCKNLDSNNIMHFDTSNVTNMSDMFYGCYMTNIDISNFNTSKVTDMSTMFSDCSNLKSLDMGGFDTGNVTDISQMFNNCSALESLDLSSFNFKNIEKADHVFSTCSNLNTIKTPKNVIVKIQLPASEEGYNWYYGKEEITLLPQNLSNSVEITRSKGINEEESSGTEESSKPATPAITTTKIPSAVQNVPYEAVIENDGWDATYQISKGALPEGIGLSSDGVIYGVTKESGKFKFTVTMTVNNPSTTVEKAYTLEVQKNTDKAVNAIEDPGYEIIQPISDIDIREEVTADTFISKGPYEEFRNAYIDGNKLVRDVDYTAESGSTRITIKAETLDKLEVGKHTLGVEFRTSDNSLKRVAQNFNVRNGKSGGKGSSSGSNSSSENSQSASGKPQVTVTANNVTESVSADNVYYSVMLPSDDAILRISFFNKVYGDNATILAYLDNGIGYNLNMNAFLSAGKDLNLSTKEIELNGFAQGFNTIWLSIAEKIQLGYGLGINLNAGAEYANHPVYIFIYDDAVGTFTPYTETIVTEYGNVGFYTRRLTDFIVMIAQ